MQEFGMNYKVDRDEDHTYYIETKDGKITVPGTTNILNVVGSKDKLNRIVGWSKKQALLKVAEHIRTFSGKPLLVDEKWIESVRKSAWMQDRNKFKQAGDTGTCLHDAIDLDTNGGIPVIREDIKIGWENYQTWKKRCGIKILKGDTKVGSIVHGFGGALDGIGEKNGRGVVDYKTSNHINDEYALQAGGAYTIAAEETIKGFKAEWALVVRFGKEELGDIEERYINIPAAKTAFIRALGLHNAMQAKLWAVV